MGFFSTALEANYARFFRKLRVIAREEHRFFPALVADSLVCLARYGTGLSDYLSYQMYKRTPQERKEYFGSTREEKFYEIVSPSAYKKRFTVKPDFLREFSAYTRRDMTQPGRDSFEDFCAFLEKHAVFMYKPASGLCGRGIEKLRSADITDRKAFYDDAAANQMFLEEVVHQHPAMNVLCPACVNTMRVVTFNDHGKSEILWLGQRVGNGVNSVDNFHAQGVIVAVDMETGKLVGNGTDKDNVEYEFHPTTGVRYDGFQLPDFEEAKALCLKGALESDKILVIGWDVAFSDKGPLIIEANRWPGFDVIQVADKRGRMDIVRSVLARLPERQ